MKDYMGRDESVEDNVRRRLDGWEHDSGAMEAAEQTGRNCVGYLSKLTATLVERGVIDEDLVDSMLQGVY
jgi:hypothetical protein